MGSHDTIDGSISRRNVLTASAVMEVGRAGGTGRDTWSA